MEIWSAEPDERRGRGRRIRLMRAALGSFVFFLVAPGVVAGWIPYGLSGWRFGPPLLGLPGERWMGGLLVAIGLAGLVECFARFALQGRGTPAPVAPPAILVVGGLYRHVRNPMYVAVTAMIAGQAVLFGSRALLAYAAGVWLLFHLFVVGYEEGALRRQFGAAYDRYRAHVRRWWPRLRPWTDGGPEHDDGATSRAG